MGLFSKIFESIDHWLCGTSSIRSIKKHKQIRSKIYTPKPLDPLVKKLKQAFSYVDHRSRLKYPYVVDLKCDDIYNLSSLQYWHEFIYHVDLMQKNDPLLEIERPKIELDKKFINSFHSELSWLKSEKYDTLSGFHLIYPEPPKVLPFSKMPNAPIILKKEEKKLIGRFYFKNEDEAAHFKLVWQ